MIFPENFTDGWFPTVDQLLERNADEDEKSIPLLEYFAGDPIPEETDPEYQETVQFCKDLLKEKGKSGSII